MSEARQLAHRVALRVVFAGGVTTGLLFTGLGLLLPARAGERPLSGWERSVEEVIGGLILLPLSYWYLRRVTARKLTWLAEDREISADEQVAVLTHSRNTAFVAGEVWLVIAAVAFVWNIVETTFERPIVHELLNAGAVGIAGVTSAGVVWLVTERSLAPLYPRILGGQPPPQTAISLRRRFFWTWATGSLAPMLMILLVVAWRPDADVGALLAALTGVAIVTSGIVSTAVARGIARPLGDLRRAVDRVKAGDLDVAVSVDDATEVGVLEAGFNDMTAGLRERQRLQDLFGRHVGLEVAQRALETGVSLGGETRRVSALFVDVVGSTAMAAQRSPAEVVGLLNEFFAAVVRVVGDEGGWVNKFEGDGALCVFGAPADQPDHEARALRAARLLNGELVRVIDAAIGVSCGDAVAGNVGTEDRYEYTVIGDPVNEAARLTDEAKRHPVRVLASGRVVHAAGDEAANWEPAGETVLRGRSEPTVLFAPVG